MNLKDKVKELYLHIPTIFLSLKDKSTPFIAKVFAFVTISYALSPIDLIPDFIPLLGYLDDLIILPLLITVTLKLIPKDIYASNKQKAQELLKDNLPIKWYYAVPIVLIWILIIYLILTKINSH